MIHDVKITVCNVIKLAVLQPTKYHENSQTHHTEIVTLGVLSRVLQCVMSAHDWRFASTVAKWEKVKALKWSLMKKEEKNKE